VLRKFWTIEEKPFSANLEDKVAVKSGTVDTSRMIAWSRGSGQRTSESSENTPASVVT
jgi:hypothetical protein